jgi:modulator of FtsH protease HflK
MVHNPWDGGSKNPWGDNNKNRPNNHGGNNNLPPDFEKFFSDIKNKLQKIPSNGSGNNWIIGIFACVAVAGWLSTGFYRVKTGEQGVILQFGKYLKTTTSGLNYHLPYPIQQKMLVDMELNRNVKCWA